MISFDYIFYRISLFYKESINEKNGEALGALFVALIQIFIFGILMLIFAVFSRDFNKIIFNGFFNHKPWKPWVNLIPLTILGYNFYKYFSLKTFDYFKTKWIMEDINTKQRKGWIIAILSVFIFLTAIILALLRQSIYN